MESFLAINRLLHHTEFRPFSIRNLQINNISNEPTSYLNSNTTDWPDNRWERGKKTHPFSNSPTPQEDTFHGTNQARKNSRDCFRRAIDKISTNSSYNRDFKCGDSRIKLEELKERWNGMENAQHLAENHSPWSQVRLDALTQKP